MPNYIFSIVGDKLHFTSRGCVKMEWHTLFSCIFYPKCLECRDKGSPPIAEGARGGVVWIPQTL